MLMLYYSKNLREVLHTASKAKLFLLKKYKENTLHTNT